MNCPECGKEVKDDPALAYCPYCGAQLKWVYVQVSNAPQVRKETSSTSWGAIGTICIIMSIVLFMGAFFAGRYSQSEFIGIYPYGGWRTTYPYQQYVFPLGLFGVLVLIVGIVGLAQRAEQKK